MTERVVLPRPHRRHGHLALAGGVMHFVEAGDGPPLLLLHGGHGSWVHWLANIDALAQQHRVLVPDMPGFGASYDPGRALGLDDYRQVVEAFLDAVAPGQLDVAGFSFGSIVATAVALHNPGRIDSLTLVNPPGTGTRTAQAAALPGELSLVARDHGLHAGVAASLARLMLCDATLVTPELVELIAGCVTNTRYVTRQLSRNAGLLDMLARLRQPHQVLIGAADPYQRQVTLDHATQLRQRLPRAGIHIVPGAAHWLQFEQAQAFNALLLEFIAHRPVAPAPPPPAAGHGPQ